MRTGIVLSLAILGAFCAARQARAAYPELRARDPEQQEQLRPRLAKIPTGHPRIFFRAGELDAVRQRIEQVPQVAETYGWLMEWVQAGNFYENLWATPNQLMAASVAYRLSEDPEALSFAIRIAEYLAQAEGDSWTWPRIAKGLAFAYDWLYDDLTPEQRTRYGRAALNAAKACYDTWRHSEFNNHLYLEYGPILYVGIALYGDGIDDAVAERLALDGLDLLVNHMMPAHEIVNAGDGGWHESMSYHAFFTYEFAHLIELWQSATGEDLWSGFNGLDGEGAFQAYATRPFDRGWVGVADIGRRDSFSEANASYLVLVARRRRDGVARAWTDLLRDEAIRRRARGVKYVRDGSAWWPYVLWYDPTVPAVAPEELPTARLFRGIGWAAMRSDWTPDATYALFIDAPLWLGGHQHADNNSFIIHRKGLLAIDSGVYDATAHRANYYARTIAHNSITVFDPDEQFNGGVWGSGKPGEGENDGGQLYTGGPDLVSDITEDSPYRRGQILAYEHGGPFTYVLGDATKSYSAAKLREFTRAFLFVRPGLFIVFDRVEATRPEFVKTWLLHSASQPEEDDGQIVISNGKALLRVWTVFPKEVSRTIVGGEGHEFEVNGRNYPPTKRYDPEEAGRWRVEIRPAEHAERQFFLHVLSVEDVGAPNETTIEAEEGDTWRGVTVRSASGTVRVRFQTTGDPTGTLELRDPDGQVVLPEHPFATTVEVP